MIRKGRDTRHPVHHQTETIVGGPDDDDLRRGSGRARREGETAAQIEEGHPLPPQRDDAPPRPSGSGHLCRITVTPAFDDPIEPHGALPALDPAQHSMIAPVLDASRGNY